MFGVALGCFLCYLVSKGDMPPITNDFEQRNKFDG